MSPVSRSLKVAGVSAVAAVAAGIGINQAMAAETPTPSPSASATTSPGEGTGERVGRGGQGLGHGKGLGRGVDTAALATELGVTQDKLTAALDAVRDAAKEQRKAARDQQAPGTPPTEADRAAREKAMVTALAKELGISEAKVQAAFDKLQAARQADRRASLATRLDEAVTAGKITDADKASILKAFDAGVLGGR